MVGTLAGGALMLRRQDTGPGGPTVPGLPRTWLDLARAAHRPPLLRRATTRASAVALAALILAGLARDGIAAVAIRLTDTLLHLAPAYAEVLPRWAPPCDWARLSRGEPGWSGVVGGSRRRAAADPLVYLARFSRSGERVTWDFFDRRLKWCGRFAEEPEPTMSRRFMEVVEGAPGILLQSPASSSSPCWVCLSVSPAGNELHFAARCEPMAWALAGFESFQIRSWAAKAGRAAVVQFRFDGASRTYRGEVDPSGSLPEPTSPVRALDASLPRDFKRGPTAVVPAPSPLQPELRLWSPPNGCSVRFAPSKSLTEALSEVLPG